MAAPKKKTAPSAKSAAKSAAKPAAKRASNKAPIGRGKKGKKVLYLTQLLPERMAEMDMVRKATERFDETQTVQDVAAALRDLSARMDTMEEVARERVEAHWTELAARLAGVLEAARETGPAQTLSEIPDRASDELDDMLARVGLMRIAAHEAQLEGLAKRKKTQLKAAETRGRKKAHAEMAVKAKAESAPSENG